MRYQYSLEGISEEMLQGFFVGWPNPPQPSTHLRLLENSSQIVLAIDEEANLVVGFITSISDGVLSAYIPLLEVLPAYQKKGIGEELVRRMLDQLGDIYMVDVMCDVDLQPYYERFGMIKSTGMVYRNYHRQAGK